MNTRPRKIADTFAKAPAEKKINTTLWLPVDLHKQLKLISASTGIPISALMTEAAEYVIEQYRED